MINISDLNRRIGFTTKAVTVNNAGGVSSTETASFSVWAHVKPISNKALFLQGQNIERNTYEIIIRHRDTIGNSVGITYEGRSLRIVGEPQEVTEGYKKYLKIIATENG